ncbi:MAG: thiamine phosphate synthase [Lachnospiraceae bacterium]|nr:thiamine phosphate synthase [Lachnospiraceae bacterium]
MFTFDSIIAVTNRHLSCRPFPEQLERICSCRPHAVILREKDLPESAYEELAREALAICKEYSVPCILHTYAETAKKLGCTSIHLPLPLFRRYSGEANKLILKDFSCIGTSIHSVEEALEAQQLGATYLTAGHIYATDCKKGLPPRGTDFLREVCSLVSIPVYAIGGIKADETQIQEITACGARGGCMMSEMMQI